MSGERAATAGFREDLSRLILQINSVQGLVNSIAASQSVDSIFSAMVEGIRCELNYDRVGILTLDERDASFRLNYVLGVDPLRAETVRVPLEAASGLCLSTLHRERINVLRCLNDKVFAPALYAGLGEDTAPSVILPLTAWHQKPCWQIDHCLLGFSALVDDPASWREVRVEEEDLHRVCSRCPYFPVRGILWADNRESGAPVRANLFPLWIFAKQASLSIENFLLFDRSRRLSIRDGLTGLYNRRHFLEVLGYELQRSRRFKHALGLQVVDVDGFRGLNREHGFQAGDEVVKSLAVLLRRSVREIDVVARAGIDSFAVLFPRTEPGDVRKAAERLRQKVERFPFRVGGRDLRVTVSGGTTVFPDDGDRPRDLLFLAESALAGARAAGGNRNHAAPARAERDATGAVPTPPDKVLP